MLIYIYNEIRASNQPRETKMAKGNILCGSQNPGKTQSLRYIDGKEQPNYPVPATCECADVATNYRWITNHCPEHVPCAVCVGEWEDALDYYFITGMGK